MPSWLYCTLKDVLKGSAALQMLDCGLGTNPVSLGPTKRVTLKGTWIVSSSAP